MNTLKTFLLLSALLYVSSLNTKLRGYKSLSKSRDDADPTLAVSSSTNVEVTTEVTPSSQLEVIPPVTANNDVVPEVTQPAVPEGSAEIVLPAEAAKPEDVKLEIKGDDKQSIVNRLDDVVLYISSNNGEKAQVLLADAQAALDILKNNESVDANQQDNKIILDRLLNSLGDFVDNGRGKQKGRIESLGESIIEVFNRVRNPRPDPVQGQSQSTEDPSATAAAAASASVEGDATATAV